ncbi:MAG TPA: hypothetical protein VGM44_07925 [Polyangiaceae bacterium]
MDSRAGNLKLLKRMLPAGAEAWCALVLWALVSVLSGISGALREPSYVGKPLLVQLAPLLGQGAVRFAQKCPLPLFLSALPLVVFGPAIALLLTLGAVESVPYRSVFRSAVAWLLCNAACFSIVAVIARAHGADAQLVWSWSKSLTLVSFLSCLPSIGFAAAIANLVRARAARIFFGLSAVAGLGFSSYVARAHGISWPPGLIEDELLSPKWWCVPALEAIAWCMGFASLPLLWRATSGALSARAAAHPN